MSTNDEIQSLCRNGFHPTSGVGRTYAALSYAAGMLNEIMLNSAQHSDERELAEHTLRGILGRLKGTKTDE